MDNSSSEISAEPSYSGVDVLFSAFNSTAADSSRNIGGKKSRISCVIQIQRIMEKGFPSHKKMTC